MIGGEERLCDYEACVLPGVPLEGRSDRRKHDECRRLASKARVAGGRTHRDLDQLIGAVAQIRRRPDGPAARMRARARETAPA